MWIQGLQKFCNFTFKLKKLRNYGVNFFLSPQDFQGLPKDWEKIEKGVNHSLNPNHIGMSFYNRLLKQRRIENV